MNTFPFSAVVGMELAKRSLLYHAIDPRIGGALFLGHRGCAKSTLVRGFAEILASISNGDAPFVELPLGTTEDRLLGSVNAEILVGQGKWQGRSGLIEEANGGILYIDEINLLPDHLADLILDSAASGQYQMERDGITRQIETRYILAGTMNPEEGDLRPQLSDRFAHGVKISDNFTPEERMEIVRRRMQFDDEPKSFTASFAAETADLIARLVAARGQLARIEISAESRLAIARKAGELKLEGIRAELAVLRTARCSAAWNGRSQVDESDLIEAWELCLGHRQPEKQPPSGNPPKTPFTPESKNNVRPPHTPGTPPEPRESRSDNHSLRAPTEKIHDGLLKWWLQPAPSGSQSIRNRGVISETLSLAPIAWVETLVCSIRNNWRPGQKGLQLLRAQPSRRKNLWCFLDASRSTGANQFLSAARDVLPSLAQAVRSARFHLLILDQQGIRWLARRASAKHFASVISQIETAGGKSLIAPALRMLHRQRLRCGATSRDKVLICSDGLATPLPGIQSGQTWRVLRDHIQQITRTSAFIAWLHPSPKRGLSQWLGRICDDPRVMRFQVE